MSAFRKEWSGKYARPTRYCENPLLGLTKADPLSAWCLLKAEDQYSREQERVAWWERFTTKRGLIKLIDEELAETVSLEGIGDTIQSPQWAIGKVILLGQARDSLIFDDEVKAYEAHGLGHTDAVLSALAVRLPFVNMGPLTWTAITGEGHRGWNYREQVGGWERGFAIGGSALYWGTVGFGAAIRFAPKSAVELTGQQHHPISNYVFNALERNPSLKGFYKVRDPRFVTQAKDLASHRGYQQWHRVLDQEVGGWIDASPGLTPAQFETHLKDLYLRPDLFKRFPNGLGGGQ